MLILLLRKLACATPSLRLREADPIGGSADQAETSPTQELHAWIPRNYSNIRRDCAPVVVPEQFKQDLVKRFEKRYYNATSSVPANTTTTIGLTVTLVQGTLPPLNPTEQPQPSHLPLVCPSQGSVTLPATPGILSPPGETTPVETGSPTSGSPTQDPRTPPAPTIPASPNVGQTLTSEVPVAHISDSALPLAFPTTPEPSAAGSTLLESFLGIPSTENSPTHSSSFHVIDTIPVSPAVKSSLHAEVSTLKSTGDVVGRLQPALSLPDPFSFLIVSPPAHTTTKISSTQSKITSSMNEEPSRSLASKTTFTMDASALSSLWGFRHSTFTTTVITIRTAPISASSILRTSKAVSIAVSSAFFRSSLLFWVGVMVWALGGGVLIV